MNWSIRTSPISQSLIIVAISFIFGFGYNAIRNNSLSLFASKIIVGTGDISDIDSLVAETTHLATPMMIDIDLAKQLYDRNVVFVDARDEEEFRSGHIARALNLSIIQLVSQVSPNEPIVIYCSGEGCIQSIEMSETLMLDWNFIKIFVFEGGWPEWEAAGYPVEVLE